MSKKKNPFKIHVPKLIYIDSEGKIRTRKWTKKNTRLIGIALESNTPSVQININLQGFTK